MSGSNTNDCGKNRPTKGECLVDDIGLDQTERDVLHLLRTFLLFMGKPCSKLLGDDVQDAVNRFSPEIRSDLAMAITDLFGSIRQIRKSPFNFSNPNCPCCNKIATDSERHVMEALAATRRGSTSKAHVAVMLICQGNPDEPVHTQLKRLSRTLPTQKHTPTPLYTPQIPRKVTRK